MGFYRKETHQYVTIILLLPEFSSADSSVATCVLAVPGLCRLLWCTCFSLPWHTAGRRYLSRYIQFLSHRWFQHSPFPVPASLSVVSAASHIPIRLLCHVALMVIVMPAFIFQPFYLLTEQVVYRAWFNSAAKIKSNHRENEGIIKKKAAI